MKNNFFISSTSFIKNVQSSFIRVAVFVRKHIWDIVLLVGLVSKGSDIKEYGILLPIYYYTDFFRDILELLRNVWHKRKSPERRVSFCAFCL